MRNCRFGTGASGTERNEEPQGGRPAKVARRLLVFSEFLHHLLQVLPDQQLGVMELPGVTLEADEAAVILKEEMENAVNMRVKLEADVGRGRTWYDAKG